jgi:hypothetical protein
MKNNDIINKTTQYFCVAGGTWNKPFNILGTRGCAFECYAYGLLKCDIVCSGELLSRFPRHILKSSSHSPLPWGWSTAHPQKQLPHSTTLRMKHGTSPKAAPTFHYSEDEALPLSEILVPTSTMGATSQTTRQNYQLLWLQQLLKCH